MTIMHLGKEFSLPSLSRAARVETARPNPGLPPGKWEQVVSAALDDPLPPARRLEELDLCGKTVCIIVDDRGRPTPVGEFILPILDRLNKSGAPDGRIRIVTASGMHDPMTEEELALKLGETAMRRVHCSSHDAGNQEGLRFMGITSRGSPVWVNRYAAEADFRIAAGRIHPHVCYGYEGGYKMICPGISSFETIVRDHGMNFSDNSRYGNVYDNISRSEADDIGRMVGIDYLINFVVDSKDRPIKAFAGSCDPVFRRGVDFGERNVWGTKISRKADIAVVSVPKEGDFRLSNNPMYYLQLAFDATARDGVLIAFLEDRTEKRRPTVQGIDLSALSVGELLRLHEKRTWNCSEREVQHIIKAIRSEYYLRRVVELHAPLLSIVSGSFSAAKLERYRARLFADPERALSAALDAKPDAHVLLIPEGTETIPIVEYSFPADREV